MQNHFLNLPGLKNASPSTPFHLSGNKSLVTVTTMTTPLFLQSGTLTINRQQDDLLVEIAHRLSWPECRHGRLRVTIYADCTKPPAFISISAATSYIQQASVA
jgi:hypothetical protein